MVCRKVDSSGLGITIQFWASSWALHVAGLIRQQALAEYASQILITRAPGLCLVILLEGPWDVVGRVILGK